MPDDYHYNPASDALDDMSWISSSSNRDRSTRALAQAEAPFYLRQQTSNKYPPIATPSSYNTTQNPLAYSRAGLEAHGLDDFDRRLLGLPQQGFAPSMSTEVPTPRMSLPSSHVAQRRILGDASHHFRPVFMHNPTQHSPFLSQQPGPAPVTSTHAPDSQIVVRRQPPLSYPFAIPESRPVTPPRRLQSTPDPQTFENVSSPVGFGAESSPLTRSSAVKDRPNYHRRQNGQTSQLPVALGTGNLDTVPPVVNNIRLISPRQALPSNFHPVFPHELFNYIQSKCFPLVYGSGDNVVISAPTGSGKTVILEMAICKLLGSPGGENFKIVYQAPTKSLCSERARDWEQKFRHLNISCIELTGDTSQAQARRVGSASIIVTTPEKWDSITRKWSDHRKLLEMVRLVLIDEVHILKDIRGATLEAVVSRMKTIGAHVRFVALSATVPNIKDIATWLGLNHGNQVSPAHFEAFGEELRPVQLKKYVYGFPPKSNAFVFEKTLDDKLQVLLSKHSEKKPIMVFCFTRKSCEATARKLAEWWSACSNEDRAWAAPLRQIKVLHRDLQEIAPYGVAYHHAGLDSQDRTTVEQGFLNGDLLVICCTSTLAVGVNLPCHTVVLKGTVGYSNNQMQEYSDLEVMQMLGRAGRPQFDKGAVGIIMTTHENVQRYSAMVSGEQMLESTLHLNLLEHLNSEVGLGTIKDIPAARKWVSGTFLSVRMRQAPNHYNEGGIRSPADADARMQEWCERDISLLQEHGLISESSPFSCTEYGNAMARYMVQFETMKHLLAIRRSASLEDMLNDLCQGQEFEEFRPKPSERTFLRSINGEKFVRFPIAGNVTETWHKVSLIVQVYLGGCEWPNEKDLGGLKRQLATEKHIIFDRLNRLVRCLIDCKAYDGDGAGTRNALELARCLSANAWDGLPCQLAQIPGFGPVAVRKWNARGINTVKRIAAMDFQEIERIASRNPPFGRNLSKTLADFPQLQLDTTLHEPRAKSSPQDEVIVSVHAQLRHSTPNRSPSWNKKIPAVTFIVVTSEGVLSYVWRGNIKQVDSENGLSLKFSVSLSRPAQTIMCSFSCEEIVGTEVVSELRSELPAEMFTLRAPTLSEQRVVDNNIPRKSAKEIEYDDVSDEDLLDALDPSPALDELQQDTGDDRPEHWSQSDFPLIDDVLREAETPQTYEPARMDNGRWMCNHVCRNKGLTKAGKPCSHKCCAEGLDRPRAPQVLKKAKPAAGKDASGYGQKLAHVGEKDSRQQSRDDTIFSLKGSRKRLRDDPWAWPGQKEPAYENPRTKRASDVDCIDLSALSEDDLIGGTKSNSKRTLSSAEKGKQKITNLHRRISGTTRETPRLTKSYHSHADSARTHTSAATDRPSEPASIARRAPKLSHQNDTVFDELASGSDDDDLPAIEEIMRGLHEGKAESTATHGSLDDAANGFNAAQASAKHEMSTSPHSIEQWCEFPTGPVSASPPAQHVLYDGDLKRPIHEDRRNMDLLENNKQDDSQHNEPLFFGDPFQVSIDPDSVSSKASAPLNEPAWVATMDPDLIDSLRDVVNFLE